jgi:hypothetical protein
MKTIILLTIVLFTLNSQAELSETETKYLKLFANYTGGMGIGFVDSHTFDYQFRQSILKSKDEKVQKSYILYELPRHLEFILHDLEKNQKMVGKGIYEKLTKDERKALLKRFEEGFSLYKKLDNKKHKHFYEEYEKRYSKEKTKK